MITNLPSEESLNASALRAHFLACETLFTVIDAFHSFHAHNPDDSEVTWHHEWNEYLQRSRFDLEDIYKNIAQANELSLRAKVCAVSPYLLLINTENRLRSSEQDIDFTELRTIDAVDLPRVAKSICDIELSPNFLNNYGRVRSKRNKIMHLGLVEATFDYEELISLLSEQYSILWSGERWLPNWVEYASRKRISHFFDYKNYTEYTDVMDLIPIVVDSLTKSQFELLFGFPKNRRRYICHVCCDNACIERHGAYLGDYKTSYLKDEGTLFCAMCYEEYAVDRQKCIEGDCKGDVIFSNENYGVVCCSCGTEQT